MAAERTRRERLVGAALSWLSFWLLIGSAFFASVTGTGWYVAGWVLGALAMSHFRPWEA